MMTIPFLEGIDPHWQGAIFTVPGIILAIVALASGKNLPSWAASFAARCLFGLLAVLLLWWATTIIGPAPIGMGTILIVQSIWRRWRVQNRVKGENELG